MNGMDLKIIKYLISPMLVLCSSLNNSCKNSIMRTITILLRQGSFELYTRRNEIFLLLYCDSISGQILSKLSHIELWQNEFMLQGVYASAVMWVLNPNKQYNIY
jgi:hypothetical protein